MILKGEGDQLITLPQKCEEVHENEVPFVPTTQGLYIEDNKGLAVSSCGHRVWGCFIAYTDQDDVAYKLVRLGFRTDSAFPYNFEHRNIMISVRISEQLNLAMSGGCDKTLVLHDLTSGSIIKKFAMNSFVNCLLNLGTSLAVGQRSTVKFFDLGSKKRIRHISFEGGFKYILCFESKVLQDPGNGQRQLMLFVGRDETTEIQVITLPESIRDHSKGSFKENKGVTILKGNFEEVIRLEKVNEYLKSESKRVKEKLQSIARKG